jgi:hypothetical protein
MRASKGVGRLALLLGSIGSTVWLIFVAFASKLFTEIEAPRGWVALVVLLGYVFLFRFCLSMELHGSFEVFEKTNKRKAI